MIEFGTFLAYLAALLAFAWLCVGAVVVTTFMVDVVVAAVRATSVVALNVKVSGRISGALNWLAVASSWRRILFALYRNREKRVTYTFMNDSQPVARWRGVFRWEFLKPGEQSSGVEE